MQNGKIHLGTSGFSYKDWLGNFYPQFCPQSDFLKFYSSVFDTVELDSTYYRIPTIEMVKKWDKVTPSRFKFTAKFPRTVTHEGDISSRIDNLKAFVDAISILGKKLGPLLLQFPYSFKPDESFGIMEKLIMSLPDGCRYAVEVRNKKWLGEEFYSLLRENKTGLCLVDHPWMPKKTEYTSDFLYLRFLGDRKKIDSDFSHIRFDREDDLLWWSSLIEEFSRERGEVYGYVNNHYSGHSPTTLKRMLEILDSRQ